MKMSYQIHLNLSKVPVKQTPSRRGLFYVY